MHVNIYVGTDIGIMTIWLEDKREKNSIELIETSITSLEAHKQIYLKYHSFFQFSVSKRETILDRKILQITHQ